MCSQVTSFDSELSALVDRMFATMTIHEGIGLAAPQIGVFQRVAIVHLPRVFDKPQKVIVNPVIISGLGKSQLVEGCLSIPGDRVNGRVKRFNAVKFSYQDVTGETHVEEVGGLEARAVQHETDHLNGLFFTDHMSMFKRKIILQNHDRAIRQKVGEDLRSYYVTKEEQEAMNGACVGS